MRRDFQIYSINPDGTGMTQVTNAAQAFNPTGSPDGRQIAFNSNRDGKFDVFVMHADGTGVPTKLTSNAGDNTPASWSPTGQQILFVRNLAGDNELCVMNADGTGVKQLTTNEGEGDHEEIYIMNADGTGQTRLTFNQGIFNAVLSWRARPLP